MARPAANPLDKKHPFFYTPVRIDIRPLLDTSQVLDGLPYKVHLRNDARVTVPKGLMALMSAENPQQVMSRQRLFTTSKWIYQCPPTSWRWQ